MADTHARDARKIQHVCPDCPVVPTNHRLIIDCSVLTIEHICLTAVQRIVTYLCARSFQDIHSINYFGIRTFAPACRAGWRPDYAWGLGTYIYSFFIKRTLDAHTTPRAWLCAGGVTRKSARPSDLRGRGTLAAIMLSPRRCMEPTFLLFARHRVKWRSPHARACCRPMTTSLASAVKASMNG